VSLPVGMLHLVWLSASSEYPVKLQQTNSA